MEEAWEGLSASERYALLAEEVAHTAANLPSPPTLAEAKEGNWHALMLSQLHVRLVAAARSLWSALVLAQGHATGLESMQKGNGSRL